MQIDISQCLSYDILYEIILHLAPENQLVACCVNKLIRDMRLTGWLMANNWAREHIQLFQTKQHFNMAPLIANKQDLFTKMALDLSFANKVSVNQWIARYYMAEIEELLGCGCRTDYPYHYYKQAERFETRSRRISYNKEYNILRNITYLKLHHYYDIYNSLTLRALID